MIVLTGEYNQNQEAVEVLCAECYRSVGWLTLAELGGLSVRCGDGRILCFECDGGSDEVPDVLMPRPDTRIWLRGQGLGGRDFHMDYWALRQW